MTMPEATVNENHLAAPGENKIRYARQVSAVQTEAVTEGMNEPANHEFRFGVLTADERHLSAADGIHVMESRRPHQRCPRELPRHQSPAPQRPSGLG